MEPGDEQEERFIRPITCKDFLSSGVSESLRLANSDLSDRGVPGNVSHYFLRAYSSRGAVAGVWVQFRRGCLLLLHLHCFHFLH